MCYCVCFIIIITIIVVVVVVLGIIIIAAIVIIISLGLNGPRVLFFAGDNVIISHPVSVTNNVCSHCAVHFLSAVDVHPSFHMISLVPPMVNIGSIVNVIPASIVPGSLFR